jgi:predicted ATPase
MLELGDVQVDLPHRTVRRGDQTAALTALEAALLGYLLARSGEPVSRDELLREVWGYAASKSWRAVDSAVFRVRQKIEDDARRPVHLLTVHGEGYTLAITAPPAPRATSDLVGRDGQLATIIELSAAAGLTTVVGPPGVGKTRLARDLPTSLFVPLAPTGDLESICAAVFAAYDVDLPAVRDADALVGHVAHLLATVDGLVILDNAEHVLDPLRAAVRRWLARVPRLRLLVTSQVPLGLPGERVTRLGPLEPADAATLFRRRADQSGTTADADAIDRVVARLDGLPLALELAAARLRTISIIDLEDRLDHRFALLARTGAQTERHDTLANALGWAWDLLDDEDRTALATCSVFSGTFGLSAAEAVMTGPRWPADALARLVERSLIQLRTGRDGRGRYNLLDAIKDLATTRHPSPAGAQTRHAAHYADVARSWLERGVGEREDVSDMLAALEHAAPGDVADIALAVAPWRGTVDARLAVLDRAVDAAAGDPERLARSLRERAAAHRLAADLTAEQRDLRHAATLVPQLSPGSRARVQATLLDTLADPKSPEASTLLADAMRNATESGDPVLIASVRSNQL